VVALVASKEIHNIKWPNDIMSSNFKIGGILIENSLKSDGAVSSVV
jgi:BirA family biotin operon repressor/biotin-[acetyl-CoA-carboxylase] ligase